MRLLTNVSRVTTRFFLLNPRCADVVVKVFRHCPNLANTVCGHYLIHRVAVFYAYQKADATFRIKILEHYGLASYFSLLQKLPAYVTHLNSISALGQRNFNQ